MVSERGEESSFPLTPIRYDKNNRSNQSNLTNLINDKLLRSNFSFYLSKNLNSAWRQYCRLSGKDGCWLVEEATRHRIDANLMDGYGYQWWVDDDGWYTALGYMGQFIMIFPRSNIVAVFTGGTPETYDYNIQLTNRFIIPAAEG